MNEMTQANATAHTALGCRNGLAGVSGRWARWAWWAEWEGVDAMATIV
jgi:hypothetical protein